MSQGEILKGKILINSHPKRNAPGHRDNDKNNNKEERDKGHRLRFECKVAKQICDIVAICDHFWDLDYFFSFPINRRSFRLSILFTMTYR